MHSRCAEINLNAAGGEDGGGMVVSYPEGGQVLEGLCHKNKCTVG